jgi:hypothetical protein
MGVTGRVGFLFQLEPSSSHIAADKADYHTAYEIRSEYACAMVINSLVLFCETATTKHIFRHFNGGAYVATAHGFFHMDPSTFCISSLASITQRSFQLAMFF